jgi:hypothetical protein
MNYSSGLSFAVLECVKKRTGKRGVQLCFTLQEIYTSVYANNETLNLI